MKKRLLILAALFVVLASSQVNPRSTPPAYAASPVCTTYNKYWFANEIQGPLYNTVGFGVFYLRMHHQVCVTANLITSFVVDMDYTSETSLGYAEGWRVYPDPQVAVYTISSNRAYRVNYTGTVRVCLGYVTPLCGGSMSYYLSSYLVAPIANGGGPVANNGIGSIAKSLRIVPSGNFPSNHSLTLCNDWGPGGGGCYPQP